MNTKNKTKIMKLSNNLISIETSGINSQNSAIFYLKTLWTKRIESLLLCEWINTNIHNNLGADLNQLSKDDICEYNLENLKKIYNRILFSSQLFIKETESGFLNCATLFSKNSIDPLWAWRKSTILRKRLANYFLEAGYCEKYTFYHAVLTVSHKHGVYGGKTIYARKLIADFNLLRKYADFKENVKGGVYSLEITQSENDNGLHIHIHNLLYSEPAADLSKIKKHWKNLTKNTSNFQPLFLEKIYVYEKKDGYKLKTYPKTPECFFKAVQEALKYGFKHENDIKIEITTFIEIVNECKGLRFISRYGELYGKKELNQIVSENDDDFLGEISETEDTNGSHVYQYPAEALIIERHGKEIKIFIDKTKADKIELINNSIKKTISTRIYQKN